MNLEWSVLRLDSHGETVIVDYRPYRPGSFGGAGYIETQLGGFDAHKGETYEIAIRVKQLAPELRAAAPHIKVEAGRIYWEKWVIFAQISLLFGESVGIVGLSFLIASVMTRRNQTNT